MKDTIHESLLPANQEDHARKIVKRAIFNLGRTKDGRFRMTRREQILDRVRNKWLGKLM